MPIEMTPTVGRPSVPRARLAELSESPESLGRPVMNHKTFTPRESRRARLMKTLGVGTYDELILLFARAGMVSPGKRAASGQSHRTATAPPMKGFPIHSPARRDYCA